MLNLLLRYYYIGTLDNIIISQKFMTPEDVNEQKRIEYYAASVNAWFNTTLEHDKSVFTLSAGGIGLLITILTTVGLSSVLELVLYICAILSFVISLFSILWVFKRNSTHIEEILSDKAGSVDPLLKKLDLAALFAFGFGVFFTAFIGISSAINSYSTKEKNMSSENKSKSQPVQIRESFNGVVNIKPSIDVTKSFNGASNLQPQPTANATATSTPASTAPVSPPISNSQSNDKK